MKVLNDIDFQNSAHLVNVPDPTAPHHGANKDYVDTRPDKIEGQLLEGSNASTRMKRAGTLSTIYLDADASGDATLDILKNGVSMVGAGTAPGLSSEQNKIINSFSGWTSTAFAAGDRITLVPSGFATISQLDVSIIYT